MHNETGKYLPCKCSGDGAVHALKQSTSTLTYLDPCSLRVYLFIPITSYIRIILVQKQQICWFLQPFSLAWQSAFSYPQRKTPPNNLGWL